MNFSVFQYENKMVFPDVYGMSYISLWSVCETVRCDDYFAAHHAAYRQVSVQFSAVKLCGFINASSCWRSLFFF